MTAERKITVAEMSPKEMCEWAKNMYLDASNFCDEAKSYWEAMRRHNDNVATLWQQILALMSEENCEDDVRECVEVMITVFEAMNILRSKNFSSLYDSDINSADKWLEQAIQHNDPDATRGEMEANRQRFLLAYNKYKAQLGLNTQDDVARLTGIDRRHISRIETGNVKPQFKTIKLLAEKFNAPIEEFLGYTPPAQ